jgi:predicted glycoside hydrolase/deacetylase ChbG (UPF0249 family)
MAPGRRQLAVNADDFGFTRDVNEGIVHAHREGILTSTTLMANGAAFHHAVELAHATPSLDIGVHFVLVGGPGQPETVPQLIRALLRRQVDVYATLRAQMERVLQAGIRPTHLDTHKHTHLLPPVLEAVARLGEEFGVTWVRRPFDLPLTGAPSEIPWTKRAVSAGFRSVRQQFHARLSRHGCRTTDWFAGFQITGRFSAHDVVHLIENLPPGSTEFMVHPGYCRDELRAARTRLKDSREAELRALLSPEVCAAIQRTGVELTPYSRL